VPKGSRVSTEPSVTRRSCAISLIPSPRANRPGTLWSAFPVRVEACQAYLHPPATCLPAVTTASRHPKPCSLNVHSSRQDALPLTGGVLTGLAAVPGSQAGPRNALPRSPAPARFPIVLALGASLHAVGQRASIATLIAASTPAAVIGGAVPGPGGPGVVEAGLIAGLARAGCLRIRPVAALLIQQFFTAGPPPVRRWATLAWMRRRESI
jgi:hypothetical protein